MKTKIHEALATTAIGSGATLYTAAADALRSTKVDVAKALPAFVKALQNSTALLSALANDYLNRVAADMRNAARTTVVDAVKARRTRSAGGSCSSRPRPPPERI
jgi:hypothetical protein